MAEYFKQIKGKLVKCEKDQWFEKNKFYRYGQRVKTVRPGCTAGVRYSNYYLKIHFNSKCGCK